MSVFFQNLDDYDVLACVPAYKETEDELRKTVNSFTQASTSLRLHVVFIVDGIEKTANALKKILTITHEQPFEEAEGFCYRQGKITSHESFLSDNSVQPTTQDTEAHAIKFSLILKNKNKGKRDSQILFLNLLQESVNQHLTKLGVLSLNEHEKTSILDNMQLSILLLDSDTSFQQNALDRLYEAMWNRKQKNICGAAGMTLPRSNSTNPLVAAQSYEYLFLDSFLSKAPNSFMGTVQCLQGAFCMYKASNCLNEEVIATYGKDTDEVESLYEKVKLAVGEDRYLTTIFLRLGYRTIFESEAKSYTSPPPTFSKLLLQRKRWNNSIVANQIELISQPIKTSSFLDQMYIKFLKLSAMIELLLFFISPALLLHFYYDFILLLFGDRLVSSLTFDMFALALFPILILLLLLLKANQHERFYNIASIIICLLGVIPMCNYFRVLFKMIENFNNEHFLLDQKVLCFLPILILFSISIRFRLLNLTFLWSFICSMLVAPFYGIMIPFYSFAYFDDVSWSGIETEKNKTSHSIEWAQERIKAGRRTKYIQLAVLLFLNFILINIHSVISIDAINWVFLFLFGLTVLPKFIMSLAYQNVTQKNKQWAAREVRECKALS